MSAWRILIYYHCLKYVNIARISLKKGCKLLIFPSLTFCPLEPSPLFWSSAPLSMLHRCIDNFAGKFGLTTALNACSGLILAHNLDWHVRILKNVITRRVCHEWKEPALWIPPLTNTLCPSPSFTLNIFEMRRHVQLESLSHPHFSCHSILQGNL